MRKEIKLEKRKPTFDYILNDLALDSLINRVYFGIATNQDKFDFNYQVKLMQKEISILNNIINELERQSRLGVLENEKSNNEYAKGLATAYDYIYRLIRELKEGKK